MHRRGSGFLLTLAITFVLAFTGCLGKSSSNSGNGGVQSITLSPGGNLSIDSGATLIFSATAKDASGQVILGVNIQFVVVSGNPNVSAPLSVVSNGSACAGTWDPSATMCSPGTPGIAIVTAVTAGVSSPPSTIYVHQHIDSVLISQAETQPPQYDCFSQKQTWQFQGTAFSNGVDITSTVGPMFWSSSNPGVVTTDSTLPTLLPNQVQTTAKAPGVTQLFASVAGTTSSPYKYMTCLVQSVRLQVQGSAGNSVTVSNGGSTVILATAVDTLGVTLASPPLTWSTTNPEVVAFSSTTNITGSNTATARNNLGGATVFASCTPPSCNIGVVPGLPVYASDGPLPNGLTGYSTVSIDVISTTKPPTYTAWATTTDCGNNPGCYSALFPLTPGTTPIGAILTLPRTPNSMMFNHLSTARVYFGSNQGLMYVDVSATNPAVALVSTSSTPCNVSLCGKVLTISNDGTLVVVSDTVSTPSQVYIYNSNSNGAAPVDLIIPGETATAAAFSPDQLKLFILTAAGNMYVYSTVDALTSLSISPPANDVKFSIDGSFAYVALPPAPPSVSGSISGFANCDTPTTSVLSGVSTRENPLAIYPLPTIQLDATGNPAEVVLALDPPYIDKFGISVNQHPLLYDQYVCNPPSVALDTNFHRTSFDLGQGSFTPIYTQLVADGAEVIIVANNIPAVLVFNVGSGLTTSIPLAGGSLPLAASATTDGSQVFVAASDPCQPGSTCPAGSVHIIDTNIQSDYQQVPYVNVNDNNNPNMCNNQGGSAPLCLPNLIAIKPQ